MILRKGKIEKRRHTGLFFRSRFKIVWQPADWRHYVIGAALYLCPHHRLLNENINTNKNTNTAMGTALSLCLPNTRVLFAAERKHKSKTLGKVLPPSIPECSLSNKTQLESASQISQRIFNIQLFREDYFTHGDDIFSRKSWIYTSITHNFFLLDKFSLLLLFIVGPWRGDKSSFLEYGLAIWGKFDFPWWCWPSSPSTLRTLVTGACGDDVDHHHLYLRHHHQVRVVVMLTNLVEGCGFPSLKCALYWPDKVPPSSYSFGRMVLLQIIIFYKWCQ